MISLFLNIGTIPSAGALVILIFLYNYNSKERRSEFVLNKLFKSFNNIIQFVQFLLFHFSLFNE